jgi:Holliday junction DNA helicase RuvA
MLAYLRGTILIHTKDGAIITTSDLGYEVIGAWLHKEAVGTQVTVWTYQYLENQSVPHLVALQSETARSLFLELISVSGVGPKMGSRILDTLPPTELIRAIHTGNTTALCRVKGLGKKTAQKMILELGKILVTEATPAYAGLYEALTALGFRTEEIDQALKATSIDGMDEDQAITAILRALGRHK